MQSDDEADFLDDKYVNKFEKKLKKKLFTKQGIINFFNEYSWHDDPDKMKKVQKQWKHDIDTPLFQFRTKKTGSKLSTKEPLMWNRILIPLVDGNTLKRNNEIKDYFCRLCHDSDTRVKWDKGIASSKTIIDDGKVHVKQVVNESPFKALINNRDRIEKKLHFRDKKENDAHYVVVSSVPDEILAT